MSTPSVEALADPQAESEPIPLRSVEAELSLRLKAAQAEDGGTVHRSQMSNLVIYCDDEEEFRNVERDIPRIVAAHPARVILLLGNSEGASEEVSATVQVRFVRSAGGARIAAERVTLRASGRSIDRLPYAVRGLLIGDLPNNLWWNTKTPPPLAGSLLADLSGRAEHVIYDSLGWHDPNHGVEETAGWLSQFVHRPGSSWRVASDLNWRRLKGWRRLLGQSLDPASAPGALESITEVAMEHGPHAVTQAWQLTSWLAAKLGWTVQAGRERDGKELSWQAEGPHGSLRLRIRRLDEGPPEVRCIRVACSLDGKPCALNFCTEDGRLSVCPEGVEGAPRTVTVPPQSLADLVARQLSDRERSTAFEEAMRVARVLAKSALGS